MTTWKTRPWMRLWAAGILAAIAAGAAILVLRRHSPTLFKKSSVFQFYMRRAQGVEVGTPVWVKGLDAGKVIRMKLEEVPATFLGGKPEEGKVLGVKVICRVFSPFHRLLREGSTVEILLLSLLGKPRVYVFPGPPGMPRAPQGVVFTQQIVRGMEGKAEEFMDRAQRVDKKTEDLFGLLESLRKDADDIDTLYNKGRNTLYALLEEGAEKEVLDRTVSRIEENMKAYLKSREGIQEDMDRLGEDPLGHAKEDWKALRANFKEAHKEARIAIEEWKRFFEDFDEFCLAAEEVTEGSKRFTDDLVVFLEAKDRVFPGILEDWYVIERKLIVQFFIRSKIADLPEPRLEENLRLIRRGRLKTEEKR